MALLDTDTGKSHCDLLSTVNCQGQERPVAILGSHTPLGGAGRLTPKIDYKSCKCMGISANMLFYIVS